MRWESYLPSASCLQETPAALVNLIHTHWFLNLYKCVYFAGDQGDIAVGTPAGVRVDGRLAQHDYRGREGIRTRDAGQN